MFFGSKKPEISKQEDTSSKDLALITQMNNDLAGSLDLKETLQNAVYGFSSAMGYSNNVPLNLLRGGPSLPKSLTTVVWWTRQVCACDKAN